jgi:hypothetical protein
METIQAELRKSMHYLSMKKRDHAADKIDALQAQVEALTAELENIANANLKTWDKDYNTAADFMAWAQSRARAAIAKETA